MAWEERRGRRYYYRARWVNGRTVKQYVGTGAAAETAARLDAEAASERARRCAVRMRTRAELEELDALLERLDREVGELVSAAMAAAGFHRHRGTWRRRKTVNAPEPPDPTPAPAAADPPTLRELVARARMGDAAALPGVRHLLDVPENVELFGGNVALRALDLTIRGMVGTDLMTDEAIHRKLDLLRAELAGPNPAPLERLLVDRVVALWLHLHKIEGEGEALGDRDPTRAGYYQTAISAAQRRYFAAIRELTRVRREALPALQVNIAREQVNVVNVPKA